MSPRVFWPQRRFRDSVRKLKLKAVSPLILTRSLRVVKWVGEFCSKVLSRHPAFIPVYEYLIANFSRASLAT